METCFLKTKHIYEVYHNPNNPLVGDCFYNIAIGFKSSLKLATSLAYLTKAINTYKIGVGEKSL